MKHTSESRFQLSPAKLALLKARLEQQGVKQARQDRIPKAESSDLMPASFAQQRLWFLERMDPGQAVYHLPSTLRLTGELDIPALEKSVTEITRRHASLRTSFVIVAGEPMQAIAEPQPTTLSLTDLRHLNKNDREREAQRLAAAEARKPFDLSAGPLWRAGLLKLDDEEHVFILTLHHIITDGWSMGLFFRELSALYETYTHGRPSPLEELELQYADYAAWQRQWLQGELLNEQLSYWKRQLNGAPPTLELPADKHRPVTQTYNAAAESFSLPATVSDDLKALSRREGVTLFMTLLAGFQILLSRYAGKTDILVATPSAGREREEVQSLIGLFVNTLILRSKIAETSSFVELLRSVKETVLGAHAHQDLPFEKIVEELDPERSLSYHPLSQVLFQLHAATREGLALEGLQCGRFLRDAAVTANFDLVLSMSETEPLSGTLNYNSDLFEAATIQRMVAHLQRLFASVAADARRQIGGIELMSEAEQRQLLTEWNETEISYPSDKCIHELFEAQVEQSPEAIALVQEEQRITYRELNERASQLARYLREEGVGPEVLVGICLERSVEMVLAVLGVLKAGGAYVPLDPAYPLERLNYMLADSKATVLLTRASLAPLPTPPAKVVYLEPGAQQFASYSKDNIAGGVTSQNLAYVIYTSGSSGKPKGVAVAHRGLCNLSVAQARQFSLTASDRVLQFSSFSFDASIFEIVMALCSGASLHLPPRDEMAVGKGLVDVLRDEAITITVLPPSVVMSSPVEDLPQLRTMLVAGEICPLELVERWAGHCEFLNLYGPTETTVWATAAKCEPERGKPSIGGPIANSSIYVLDRHMRPVPVGVCGEIFIGGPGVARGYLNRPELTAERFVPDAWAAGEGQRLYRTGDLARWRNNGQLEYLGRCDQQVKVRGFRIELGEIEAALARHESVREAVVRASGSATGNEQLIAYVVLDDAQTTTDELRIWLLRQLPEFMVPALFMMLDQIPLTPNGKIDYHALPEPTRNDAKADDYLAPRTATEQVLASIWADLLKIDKVGIDDNFFALGGHSLLAARLVTRIREECLVQLPLRSVFEAPTIALMARRVEQSQAGSTDELAAIPKLPRGTGDVDQLLEQLAQLTDQQVQAMLAQEVEAQQV